MGAATFLGTAYAGLVSFVEAHGVRITIIIVAMLIAQQVSRRLIEKLIRKAIVSDRFASSEDERKREDTLIRLADNSVHVIVWLVGILMILQEAGIDIGPLLAAAGVAGIAFGFGGQYLIRDIISGLFIIFENQYRVGDVVCFDGTCGLVEDITPRKTTLRDLDGVQHHVPHGEIKKVSNLGREFARVNLDIGVSYGAKLEKVIATINRVGADMAKDPFWKSKILKAPQFLRVNEFADSAVVVKILGDVKPLAQWEVAGELRKRIKVAFDRAKIEIPFPQRVIHTAKR